jgi:hypothetical protein
MLHPFPFFSKIYQPPTLHEQIYHYIWCTYTLTDDTLLLLLLFCTGITCQESCFNPACFFGIADESIEVAT